jgi:hypothetical protein
MYTVYLLLLVVAFSWRSVHDGFCSMLPASFPSFEGGKEMKEMKTNLWTHTRKAKTKTATDKNTLQLFFFFFFKNKKKRIPQATRQFLQVRVPGKNQTKKTV